MFVNITQIQIESDMDCFSYGKGKTMPSQKLIHFSQIRLTEVMKLKHIEYV